MANEWTYYKRLGGDRFELVRGIFRLTQSGLAERWNAETQSWISVSPWFLIDRIAEGAMDLDEISELEARQLMEDSVLLRPTQSLTAD